MSTWLKSPGVPEDSAEYPSVTIVIPALNEEAAIEVCLNTLLAQDYPAIVQILVLDGNSTDATVERASAYGPPVEVHENPKKIIAAAMNRGLQMATGEILFKADAHSTYATDYVSSCVRVLQETGAANVGGPLRPVATTRFGRAVRDVLTSPLGVGSGGARDATERGEVDTIFPGAWWVQYLRELGGWDETGIHWATEDDELNYRIRKNGGRIVVDPSIVMWYTPRETPSGLWRQYTTYGFAKTSSMAKHRDATYVRSLVPAIFVSASVVGAVLPVRWPLRIAIPTVHAAFCLVAASKITRESDADLLPTALALEICHWGYGVGFLRGLGRLASGRGFQDERSEGSRS